MVTGYGILISSASAAVKYFAIFLSVAGVSPCIALAITWVGEIDRNCDSNLILI